jgi:hypothetical protein
MSNRVYTFDYDDSYDPPFPTVQVSVSTPDHPRKELQLTVLVDSGSDGTLLPLGAIQSLGAAFVDYQRVRGLFGGSRSEHIIRHQKWMGTPPLVTHAN